MARVLKGFQFYPHTHRFIRNRNETYLPLPSQPQLVLFGNEYFQSITCTGTDRDVVLETRVLILRRLEDKNESLGLGSRSLGFEHLVLVSVLKKKSCSFQDFFRNS